VTAYYYPPIDWLKNPRPSIAGYQRLVYRHDAVLAQAAAISNRACIVLVRSLDEAFSENHDIDQKLLKLQGFIFITEKLLT
jgi:hypothetical protein